MGKKRNLQSHLVCYFDIFGFSNSENLSDKDHLKSILRIWRWITNNINKGTFSAFLFSDCGFIISRIDNNNIKDSFTNFIQFIEKLMDKYIDEDYLIRGGISYGEIVCAKNLIIGKPVNEAVRLENEICPGPFIILPIKTRDTFINSDYFMNETLEINISTKKDEGEMLCSIVLPLQRGKYMRIIKNKAQFHSKHGPPGYAKFWNNTYKLLINNFSDKFSKYITR